jgi:hypothetical protein
VEHVVFFPAPDGSPAFRRVPGLEDAVRLVEHLRNVDGVAEATVHPLGEEVPLAFRTWYRVEVPAGEAAPAPATPPVAASPVPVVPEQPVAEQLPVPVAEEPADVEPVGLEQQPEQPAEPEPVPALADPGYASNGHNDAVKSLGFFAT